MDHEGDSRYNHEHHSRDRVEEESELDYQIGGELEPGHVEDCKLEAFAGIRDKIGTSREKVSESRVIRQAQYSAHAEDAKYARKLMGHLNPDNSQEEEHEQGDGQNQQRYCNVHGCLKFHFSEVGDIYILCRTEDIDDNGYGHCSLGSSYGYQEEGKEHTLELAGEKKTVEHHEIDIDGIEHKLKRYEHGNHVLTCYESIHTTTEHHQCGHEVPNDSNIHIEY